MSADQTPAAVKDLADVKQLALGSAHACVLLGDASVKCWGDNTNGEVGDDTYEDRLAPVSIGISDAVEIAVGPAHSCARLKSGKVSCWGNNFRGELGDDKLDKGQRSKPAVVDGIENAKQLALASGTTCVLLESSVMCWGANEKGSVGIGSKDQVVKKPSKVSL